MSAFDPLAVPLAGTQLIEASAGTGKTYTLVGLYLRLLLEPPRRTVDRILVVTFTRAATAELRQRIRARLLEATAAFAGETEPADALLAGLVARSRELGLDDDDQRRHLEEQLVTFDEARILTIHGFCQRLLADHATTTDTLLDAELLADEAALVDDAVRDDWARRTYEAPDLLVAHLRRSGFVPEKLVHAIRAALSDPSLALAPAAPFDPARLEAPLSAWRRARAVLSDRWQRERETLAWVLTSSPTIDRRRFRPTTAAALVDALDRWCESADEAELVPHPDLARVTPDGLRELLPRGRRGPTHRPANDPFFASAGELVAASAALEGELGAWLGAERVAHVRAVRAALASTKEQAAVLAFDDLLARVDRALDGPLGPALLARVSGELGAALVDEFQDTDRSQYRIFRRLFGDAGEHGDGRRDGDASRPLFLIGDPKQAIYAFRGADVFAYRDASRDAGERRHALSRNHRSDPGLVAATNALLGRAERPFGLDWIRFEPVDPARDVSGLGGDEGGRPPLELLYLRGGERRALSKTEGNRRVPAIVAAEAARILESDLTIDGRPVHAGDLAVLVRTNEQALAIQADLVARGVKSVLSSDKSVLETREAWALEVLLAALLEPSSRVRLKTALATDLVGLDADAIAALERDERLADDWARRFQRLSEEWARNGIVRALTAFTEELGVRRRWLGEPGGERRVTDLAHLIELLHGAARERQLGPAALAGWFSRVRRDPAAARALGAEAAQLRVEGDDQAVRVVTVHKAKGLEYPIVFCPYLWEPPPSRRSVGDPVLFHDPEAGERLTLDLGSAELEERAALAAREGFGEALRLAYVALTRARHRTVLVWGRFAGPSPLAFFLHGAGGDGDALDRAARAATLDEAALLAEVRALVEAHAGPSGAGLIGLTELDEEPAARVLGRRVEHAPVAGRSFPAGRRLAPHVTTSFSALTAHGPRTEWVELGIDRDAGRGRAGAREAVPEADPERVPLADFPMGASAGTFFHRVLELLDFRDGASTRRGLVERELRRFGIDAGRYADMADRGVAATLDAGILDDGTCLAAVERRDRIDELEFLCPAGRGAGLSVAGLARVFAEHPDGLPEGYAERVAELSFSTVRGFLRGFVDLIFRTDGRYWVVDYKSNHLGERFSDYAPERLDAPMVDHHYVLQYHLYVVALHRLLAVRLVDYDYDRHMGGVRYLFLRGLAAGRDTGVHRARPPRARIEALDAWLGPATAPGLATGDHR